MHLSITHHAMGKHVERVLKKNSLKLNTISHNNTSWCTDPDGFLGDAPSEGRLDSKRLTFQEIILGFGVPTPIL